MTDRNISGYGSAIWTYIKELKKKKNVWYCVVCLPDICEDLELKQRLMELKDEIESNRATQIIDVKRKSQNTRRYDYCLELLIIIVYSKIILLYI